MSRNEDTTLGMAGAIVGLDHRDGRVCTSAEVFGDLAADYAAGRDTWREVTPQFARYCLEALPPILGPEGSRSYALGEMFDATRDGAVHCVIARERGRHWARYVRLMRWAEELLALRTARAAAAEWEAARASFAHADPEAERSRQIAELIEIARKGV